MTGKWCTPQLLADPLNASSKADPVGSILFFQLINFYLPSPSLSRQALRIPGAEQLEEQKLSTTCICHN